MHNERCTSGSEGGHQNPTAAMPHGADARPYRVLRYGRWLALRSLYDHRRPQSLSDPLSDRLPDGFESSQSRLRSGDAGVWNAFQN